MKINLLNHQNHELLANYIVKQLDYLIIFNQSKQQEKNKKIILKHLKNTLNRLKILINSVRIWQENVFDIYHSSQYCIFLYLLAHTIFKESNQTELPTLLFLLNKKLNAIDLFYEINLPEKFFIGHSVGIVFAKANYSNYFAIYQNCTIGRNHYGRPHIEENVIVYPNSSIIGKAHIQKNTIISPGIQLINQNTPPNTLVVQNSGGGGGIPFLTN